MPVNRIDRVRSIFWYPKNVPLWCAETMGWDCELIGLYEKALNYQFLHGRVPEEQHWSRIDPIAPKRFGEIVHLFPDGQRPWLEEEIEKAERIAAGRAKGGRKRAEQLARERKQQTQHQRNDENDDEEPF